MAKKKKTQQHSGTWKVPKNAIEYFDPHYDDDFKAKYPILYVLTVIAILILVLVAPLLYLLLCSRTLPTENMSLGQLITWIIGFVSSFGISIGICNLFMILHKQYLGHYVTIFSFAIGIGGTVISLIILR